MSKRLMFCLILVVCLSISAFSAGPKFNLSIASLEPIGAPSTVSVDMYATIVKERTDGQVVINSNPGGTLGTGLQIMEGLSMGSIDMVSMVLEWYAPFVNDINVYGMGFTFRDTDHFKAFLNSPVFDDMKQQVLKKMGVRILSANWVSLPRVMVSKKPVHSPKDIANIKMRVPEIESYLKVWQGLGTSPARVAWPEVYLALKTGTVDAAEGPLDQIYATKFYEAAPYIVLTNHLQQVFTVGINESVYKKLPQKYRDILTDAALEVGDYFQNLIESQFEIDKQKMINEGATFIEVDTVPFQEILKPVINDCEQTGFWSKGLYQKIQEIK